MIVFTFESQMIFIPAGEFLMGNDPKHMLYHHDPKHALYHLSDYYLAKTPVTNAQYLAFVQATGHDQREYWQGDKPPGAKEDHPVVNVSWYDAVAYCRWLAETTGRPYRLPTEAEWEKAARGTDGRIWPWGDEWDANKCNSAEGGKGDTTPAGAYPHGASPYGVLDMAGNVWEWCATRWQDKYPLPRVDEWNDDYLSGTSPRVCRGGAFLDNRHHVRGAYRGWDYPLIWSGDVGLRVAATA